MSTFKFEISLEGRNIAPTTVSVRELRDLLESLEIAIVKTVGPAIQGIDDDQPLVALVEIGAGSARYSFSAASPVTPDTYRLIGTAIRTRNYGHIPAAAIPGLRGLQRFSEHRQAVIKLNLVEESQQSLLAEIRPDIDLNLPSLDTVKGPTVIHGKLTRIGGTPPKARVTLLSGEALSCEISEQLAKRIGNRLYEVIALEGEAEWDITDYSLLNFRANAIAPYSEGPVREALDALGDASGATWGHGNDTSAFIGELRRG